MTSAIRLAAGLSALAAALLAAGTAAAEETQRNFAGSVQLDYLAVPTEKVARNQALDGATVELSLKVITRPPVPTSRVASAAIARFPS